MKKSFKYYALIWIVLLVVFNAVVFIVKPIIPGYTVLFDAHFWIAWFFIILSFVGNLVCAYMAFRSDNLKKVFYSIPLISISWSALIAMLVVGVVIMLIPVLPAWIAAVICIIILAFNAIAVLKATWAADTVNSIDEKITNKTSFIKSLTVDAESILARTKSDFVKAECKKVFEAVRYSDPMSDGTLSTVESKIQTKMDALSDAVSAGDEDNVKEIADELVLLIGDRNKKCKLLK